MVAPAETQITISLPLTGPLGVHDIQPVYTAEPMHRIKPIRVE